jgi:hypothetical protein
MYKKGLIEYFSILFHMSLPENGLPPGWQVRLLREGESKGKARGKQGESKGKARGRRGRRGREGEKEKEDVN